MSASLKEWKDKKLFVLTSDGRTIIGTLTGHDQVQNLILSEAVERIFSSDANVEEEPLGLFVVRGDNICLVGEYDEEKMADSSIQPPFPIPAIHQQQF